MNVISSDALVLRYCRASTLFVPFVKLHLLSVASLEEKRQLYTYTDAYGSANSAAATTLSGAKRGAPAASDAADTPSPSSPPW